MLVNISADLKFWTFPLAALLQEGFKYKVSFIHFTEVKNTIFLAKQFLSLE